MIATNRLETSIYLCVITAGVLYGFCAHLYFSPAPSMDNIGWHASLYCTLTMLVAYLMFQNIFEMIVEIVHRKYFAIHPNEITELIRQDVVQDKRQSIIKEEQIFHTNMFAKFQTIETQLIVNGYMNKDHCFIVKAHLGKLVNLINDLKAKGYFLPNRDSLIKSFFETRYNVAIGQNLEEGKRYKFKSRFSVDIP